MKKIYTLIAAALLATGAAACAAGLAATSRTGRESSDEDKR